MFMVHSFNSHLASIGRDIDFCEYVKEVNKLTNSNININLMELVNFHNKNECCIPHSFLYTFSLLTTRKGKCSVDDIVSFLKQYTEGIDYIVRHVSSRKEKNIIVKDEYYIHPKAFRKMLLQTTKFDDYIDYFLFLEDCMYFYTDYRKKINEYIGNVTLKNIDERVKLIESRLVTIFDDSY